MLHLDNTTQHQQRRVLNPFSNFIWLKNCIFAYNSILSRVSHWRPREPFWPTSGGKVEALIRSIVDATGTGNSSVCRMLEFRSKGGNSHRREETAPRAHLIGQFGRVPRHKWNESADLRSGRLGAQTCRSRYWKPAPISMGRESQTSRKGKNYCRWQSYITWLSTIYVWEP